eukprot:742618-Pyramimonas_sp.AAC.1
MSRAKPPSPELDPTRSARFWAPKSVGFGPAPSEFPTASAWGGATATIPDSAFMMKAPWMPRSAPTFVASGPAML